MVSNKPRSASKAAPTGSGTTDNAPPADPATLAFREFLRTRRRCNRLPAAGGDPDQAAAARRDYDRAVETLRHAPIASPRGARAVMSYLLIELESVEPGPWCAPLFRSMMRYLRGLEPGAGTPRAAVPRMRTS